MRHRQAGGQPAEHQRLKEENHRLTQRNATQAYTIAQKRDAWFAEKTRAEAAEAQLTSLEAREAVKDERARNDFSKLVSDLRMLLDVGSDVDLVDYVKALARHDDAMKRLIALAQKLGWNGVENARDVVEFLRAYVLKQKKAVDAFNRTRVALGIEATVGDEVVARRAATLASRALRYEEMVKVLKEAVEP